MTPESIAQNRSFILQARIRLRRIRWIKGLPSVQVMPNLATDDGKVREGLGLPSVQVMPNWLDGRKLVI